MSRIDLVRLRKRAGISQRELADMLQVRPSFLSAIENGKSRIPEEKINRILEIFELDNLDGFIIEEEVETHPMASHTHIMDQGDSFTHLLTHFHEMAHKNYPVAEDSGMKSRIEYLEKRADRLSERLDAIRDEADALRKENLRLKEICIRNGIEI